MTPAATGRAPAPKGRAAAHNPQNRFDRLEIESEVPGPDRVATQYLRDASRSLISRNQSPDVPFDVSLNPYRGCEHGCAYCYARPSHEYLGFSAGLDFESRILVKEDAPELLRRELTSPNWAPQTLALSGITDPYQPVEKKLRVTRRCLEVLAEMRHPVGLITKNALVTRDIDLLAELAKYEAVRVNVSVTTLDGGLSAKMEPRASHPRRRLDAVSKLADAGIPVGVMVAPVVPGLTDHEIPSIVEAAARAGADGAAYLVMRLPGPVEGIFLSWLERHFPDRKGKVISRLLSLREGKLSDSRFGTRMRGHGAFAQHMRRAFQLAVRRHGLDRDLPPLRTDAFRAPGRQMGLFPS
ncbi:MAG: PA0069 family radical SAM protein [Thermoanaerobaculia bacterium]|nr:PA0069 family radical SAM protein [Thermoanaerobaculia bacterium]